MEQARMIRKEWNGLLGEAQIKLHKWQSNSKELLETMPKNLREKDWLQILFDNYHGAKALGEQILILCKSPYHLRIILERAPTKHEVASTAAKIFDVLGWFSPVVVWIKILLQIWEMGLGWDGTIPKYLHGRNRRMSSHSY